MSALLGGPVVVGVDGRPEGLDALALAERLASLDDEELVVVTAYPYAPLSSRILDGPTDAAAAARALDEARRALGRRAAELVTVPGSSPGRTLHEVAEAREAAVIVVGSSSHGPAGQPRSRRSDGRDAPPCPLRGGCRTAGMGGRRPVAASDRRCRRRFGARQLGGRAR